MRIEYQDTQEWYTLTRDEIDLIAISDGAHDRYFVLFKANEVQIVWELDLVNKFIKDGFELFGITEAIEDAFDMAYQTQERR